MKLKKLYYANGMWEGKTMIYLISYETGEILLQAYAGFACDVYGENSVVRFYNDKVFIKEDLK